MILRNVYGYKDIEELVMIGVTREEVPYWINASNLHLLTSDQEGSPNSVKECLACGVPVVSTNVGNVEDLLSGVEGCFISAEKDPKELAFLVDKSLKEFPYKSIRDKFISKGFDMDYVAKKIVGLYKEIA